MQTLMLIQFSSIFIGICYLLLKIPLSAEIICEGLLESRGILDDDVLIEKPFAVEICGFLRESVETPGDPGDPGDPLPDDPDLDLLVKIRLVVELGMFVRGISEVLDSVDETGVDLLRKILLVNNFGALILGLESP